MRSATIDLDWEIDGDIYWVELHGSIEEWDIAAIGKYEQSNMKELRNFKEYDRVRKALMQDSGFGDKVDELFAEQAACSAEAAYDAMIDAKIEEAFINRKL